MPSISPAFTFQGVCMLHPHWRTSGTMASTPLPARLSWGLLLFPFCAQSQAGKGQGLDRSPPVSAVLSRTLTSNLRITQPLGPVVVRPCLAGCGSEARPAGAQRQGVSGIHFWWINYFIITSMYHSSSPNSVSPFLRELLICSLYLCTIQRP